LQNLIFGTHSRLQAEPSSVDAGPIIPGTRNADHTITFLGGDCCSEGPLGLGNQCKLLLTIFFLLGVMRDLLFRGGGAEERAKYANPMRDVKPIAETGSKPRRKKSDRQN
jgi:hypothetical protein